MTNDISYYIITSFFYKTADICSPMFVISYNHLDKVCSSLITRRTLHYADYNTLVFTIKKEIFKLKPTRPIQMYSYSRPLVAISLASHQSPGLRPTEAGTPILTLITVRQSSGSDLLKTCGSVEADSCPEADQR